MERNRYEEALLIQQGACNPSGVARALVKAIDEARAEGADTSGVEADPAVRLICHQLAFLLHVGEIDHGSLDVYSKLMNACREHASERVCELCR